MTLDTLALYLCFSASCVDLTGLTSEVHRPCIVQTQCLTLSPTYQVFFYMENRGSAAERGLSSTSTDCLSTSFRFHTFTHLENLR